TDAKGGGLTRGSLPAARGRASFCASANRTMAGIWSGAAVIRRAIAGSDDGTPFARRACYREEAAMTTEDLTIEILKALRKEMRERFDGVDKRFDGVDKRFDAMDQRFDSMDHRFDVLEERI